METLPMILSNGACIQCCVTWTYGTTAYINGIIHYTTIQVQAQDANDEMGECDQSAIVAGHHCSTSDGIGPAAAGTSDA